jgi:ComF family protein
MLAQLARDMFDFCYPPRCAACEAAAEQKHSGVMLCGQCESALRRIEAVAACGRCGLPLAEPEAPCPFCLGKGRYPYQQVLRLAPFREPLKHLVHQLKYRRQWHLGEALAGRLGEKRPVLELLASADCLLPVPLHRLRQTGRGYNQAELVARALARRARQAAGRRLPIVRPVVRLVHTDTQTHLHSPRKRVANLRHAFGLIDARLVRDKHVVVVDDVLTSGATLKALARALRPAKPASISAIVLAVVDPKGQSAG